MIHLCHESNAGLVNMRSIHPLIARSRSSSAVLSKRNKKKKKIPDENSSPPIPTLSPLPSILVGKLYRASSRSIGGCIIATMQTRATHMPRVTKRTMQTIDAPFAIHPHSNRPVLVPELLFPDDRSKPTIALLRETTQPRPNMLQPFLAVPL